MDLSEFLKKASHEEKEGTDCPAENGGRPPKDIPALHLYTVKDSGEREQFDTGSQRDSRKGKGRYDLIPWTQLLQVMESFIRYANQHDMDELDVNEMIAGAYASLVYPFDGNPIAWPNRFVIAGLTNVWAISGESIPEMVARLAHHYEAGAENYDDHNWKKGQPLTRYFDSGMRHLGQWLDGMTNEDHLAAVFFNFLGVMYTAVKISDFELPGTLDDRVWQEKSDEDEAEDEGEGVFGLPDYIVIGLF